MKKYENYPKQNLQQDFHNENNEPEGYPLYPETEDIYNRFKKDRSLDPEDITKINGFEVVGKTTEKDFTDDFTRSNLDIQGVDVNDSEEIVEIEDEEIDYFSLGGEDHTDLEVKMWDIE